MKQASRSIFLSLDPHAQVQSVDQMVSTGWNDEMFFIYLFIYLFFYLFLYLIFLVSISISVLLYCLFLSLFCCIDYICILNFLFISYYLLFL